MADGGSIRIDVYHHLEVGDSAVTAINQKLDELIALATSTQEQEVQEMADLSALTAAVTSNSTVVDSAVTLLTSLADQLRAAATDPAAVQALADQITAQSSELAEAVAANTPAAPEPPA